LIQFQEKNAATADDCPILQRQRLWSIGSRRASIPSTLLTLNHVVCFICHNSNRVAKYAISLVEFGG
jgi:hypothetical protein